MDPLIYREPLRTEQYDATNLNGNAPFFCIAGHPVDIWPLTRPLKRQDFNKLGGAFIHLKRPGLDLFKVLITAASSDLFKTFHSKWMLFLSGSRQL